MKTASNLRYNAVNKIHLHIIIYLFALCMHLPVSDVPEAVDSDTIQVTDKKITSATVQWTQAEDKHYTIHYYHLRVSTCDGSSSPQNCQELNTFKSIDNTTTYTIENLAPFTVYSLEVAAENSVGIGPYSNPVTVQCKLWWSNVYYTLPL